MTFWVPIYISRSLFSVFWVNLREECQFSLSIQKLENTCIIDYRSVCDDSLPFNINSKIIGTSSVLHFCQIHFLTPVYVLISKIDDLGPYFYCRGSLLGPYFIKSWVPIGSLFLSSEVPKSFNISVDGVLIATFCISSPT